jgi:tRNA A37 N6-isopentenylltransferase MiaA
LRLSPNDGQRIVRALEVLEASGRSILSWQADNSAPLIDRSTARLFQIEIDRPIPVSRIERRLDQMIDDGATNEVRALALVSILNCRPCAPLELPSFPPSCRGYVPKPRQSKKPRRVRVSTPSGNPPGFGIS